MKIIRLEFFEHGTKIMKTGWRLNHILFNFHSQANGGCHWRVTRPTLVTPFFHSTCEELVLSHNGDKIFTRLLTQNIKITKTRENNY